ncbi:MAG: methyltransferase domain-containing protein [Terriglobales bacterium]
MATCCPVDLDVARLRSEITTLYTRVAHDPDGEFHFHRGPEYAATFLGYDSAELQMLPAECSRSFAGIGNPHLIGPLKSGETVLDIGCGAGMDLLLAARHVGPSGKALGVDMTPEMRERARSAAAEIGFQHVEVIEGDATALPLPDNSVDVVISNGVLNLVPEKEKAFAEIVRVLRPGGRVQLADIVVEAPLSESTRRNVELWTA